MHVVSEKVARISLKHCHYSNTAKEDVVYEKACDANSINHIDPGESAIKSYFGNQKTESFHN